MSPVNVITLERAGGLWVARHSGPAAAAVRDLFGTDTLPTPFRASVPAATVLRAIEWRNPEASVQLAIGEGL